ncbi:ATP-binding protein [Kitasatospora sp. NPDC006697]|uniref:ATP-binding protein n=1 Tax=Kitasatospora sp. NPDC006697 TaxID=3364020 RepID=UPI0036CA3AF5
MITTERPQIAPAERPQDRQPGRPQISALSSMPVSEAAVPSLRHFVRDTARCWAVPEETIDALSLVVTELVTNVVLHSGSPEVTVLLTVVDRAEVTVEVKDAGRWQDRTTPREVPEDADASCGPGLDLIGRCCSWWLAFLGPAGSRVVACLPVAAAVA